MKRASSLAVAIAVLSCAVLLIAQGATPVHLGFANSKPAIFTPLRTGMVLKVSGVSYDKFGEVAGFTEEIQWSPEKKTTIKVLPPAQGQTPGKYKADRDGKPIESATEKEWDAQDVAPSIGLSPGNGVVIVRGQGGVRVNVRSTFQYDDFNRRNVATQEFTDGGASYVVKYSGHTRDGFDRLTGFVATVEKGLP